MTSPKWAAGLSPAPQAVYAYAPAFWQTRRADARGRIRYGGRTYRVLQYAHRRLELRVVEVGESHLIYAAGGETHAAVLAGA